MVNTGTAKDNIEYTELCKTIRKLMRQDIREHSTLQIKEAVQTGKGLKRLPTTKKGTTC